MFVVLPQSLEKLEVKERILQNKISIETERARDFTKSRNKKAAYECLKRKTFYESQMEQLEIFRLQVNDQMRMLKDAAEMTEP
ncbi:Snf7 [Macleaya cordata]|uniref:Snf7 n=1 Tax=Macleaya cordata TaxID=56857 RepID=A0A200R347_MACCD|nr:Snf7 [Macleaya cordata]